MTEKNTKINTFTNSPLLINHEFKDFYAQIQHAKERIGEVGEVSDDFKDKAFHQLASEQDDYVAPMEQGTLGREDNKNVNRMEYDKLERHDDKDHKTVLSNVNKL